MEKLGWAAVVLIVLKWILDIFRDTLKTMFDDWWKNRKKDATPKSYSPPVVASVSALSKKHDRWAIFELITDSLFAFFTLCMIAEQMTSSEPLTVGKGAQLIMAATLFLYITITRLR